MCTPAPPIKLLAVAVLKPVNDRLNRLPLSSAGIFADDTNNSTEGETCTRLQEHLNTI